ncbi:hypothetical protein O181_095674 [Austropuccinia psidii MF-1]|uniref:Uncharacterized protein n=1 Tax=Austropuccinia psidii MF-1 TaxID=1389203 RepID=A0A9Q3J5L3_9BASI|nr:hypothetical protein [Austropuccinia psidii MF-1]
MEATIQAKHMDLDKEEAKARARSGTSSSRKTCMEDARVAPHWPRSVPTNFEENSEPELIQGRGVGNMPRSLAEGHEILLTHQELSGSGEDHRTIRKVDPIFLQRQGQKDKELVEEPKSFIHRPEEGVGNDPSFGERRCSGVYQLQTSSRNVQYKAQRTSEEEERSKEPSGKWKRQSQLEQTLPTRVQDPQIGTFSTGKCFQYG